jgi:Na+/proline symporter
VTTWVLKRYNNELQTSEMFSTAGRTVKSGLVASAVVSSWTWAATLLQSTSVAFRYGMFVLSGLWFFKTDLSRCLGTVLVRFWRDRTDFALCNRRY